MFHCFPVYKTRPTLDIRKLMTVTEELCYSYVEREDYIVIVNHHCTSQTNCEKQKHIMLTRPQKVAGINMPLIYSYPNKCIILSAGFMHGK